jgi:stringent starvation protein B
LGIVAKENGEGMWFPREEANPEPPPQPNKKAGPPALKVVK